MKGGGLVVVTAGPSYEPIDEVRRLTNSSTGELGLMLANRLAAEGWRVLCLLGSGATVRSPLHPELEVREFTTNDDLQRHMEHLGPSVIAVFHTAALCDFRVAHIEGAEAGAGKLSSRGGNLTLTLRPAPKLIQNLRTLFPEARLVGWKYELDGTRGDAVSKGHHQLAGSRTDLCVLNGRAWGTGFGILNGAGNIVEQPDKPALCEWLAGWLERAVEVALAGT